jgi:formylmethanofuran dehydrogenase subunit E
MTICSYGFEDYVEKVRSFHGFPAPGVIIGGFMVDLARKSLPPHGLFDALCETPKCLPDAIQLLTPCSVGNGWLTIVNTGRYALILYDKTTGQGVRVFVDAAKVDRWPEIRNWYFKLTPKEGQNEQNLLGEIRDAGSIICSIREVVVAERFLQKKHRGAFTICPRCNEAYPAADGSFCLGCADGNICVPVD